MFVLRVELDNGTGVYNAGNAGYIHDAGDCPCRITDEHPMPYDDPLLKEGYYKADDGEHPVIKRGAYRFAFGSPLQYLAWFYTQAIRAKLVECDMLLRIYEVQDDAVIIGKSQVIYSKSHAALRMTLRPDMDPGSLVTLWDTLDKAPMAAAA